MPWSSYEQSVAGQEAPPAPSARSRRGTVTRQGCHSGEVVAAAAACAFPGLSAGRAAFPRVGPAAQSRRPSDQQVLDLQWL